MLFTHYWKFKFLEEKKHFKGRSVWAKSSLHQCKHDAEYWKTGNLLDTIAAPEINVYKTPNGKKKKKKWYSNIIFYLNFVLILWISCFLILRLSCYYPLRKITNKIFIYKLRSFKSQWSYANSSKPSVGKLQENSSTQKHDHCNTLCIK